MRICYLTALTFLLLVSSVLSIHSEFPSTVVLPHGDRPSDKNLGAGHNGHGTALFQPSSATQGKMRAEYGKLPLSFEANLGQVDKRVKFLTHGRGYTLFLTDDSAVLALQGVVNHSAPNLSDRGAPDEDVAVLRLKLVGGNPSPGVAGLDEQPGKTNYFIGSDPSRWHTKVLNYSRVKYRDTYPGIDLVYYGNQQQLEYDFAVAPGADPRAIVLDLEADPGIERRSVGHRQAYAHHSVPLRIAANGDLVVTTQGREVRLGKPIVYQPEERFDEAAKDESPGAASWARHFIDGRWLLEGATRVGFEVAAYDVRKPLIIDPALSYSTYLGGSGYDAIFGLAADSLGNAYVTGDTASTDFPTTAGDIQPGFGGNHDAFITKLNATGTAVVYSTYLGGTGYDRGVGIAVDASGDVYVSGNTASRNFPITAGAFQTVCGCIQRYADAFVAELNSTGSALVYSTYLGGSADDYGTAIAVDSAGDAFVAGRTCSANFPVTPGAVQTNYAGGCAPPAGGDAYVSELNPTGTALIYSTYLGGSGVDAAYAIAVDAAGNAYVAGNTASTNFPITAGALQTQNGGGLDAFVTKVNPTGSALVYSTYLGGTADETIWGIKVDAPGSAYVGGQTLSTNFPTTAGAFQVICGGGCQATDGFVSKLDPTGAFLVYSTYLGGNGEEEVFAVALDSAGNAYVTGETGSTNFPTTPGSFQASTPGGVAAFVASLNATGSSLIYSTYFGNKSTTGLSIAENDADQSIVLAGRTFSNAFPTTPGSPKTVCTTCSGQGKLSDGFVAKFIVGDQIWPLSINFGNQVVGVTSRVLNTVLSNSGSTTLNVSSIQVGGVNSSDFITTNNTCGAPVAVGSSCTISVNFKPSATGSENATLTVTDDAANSPQLVILAGAGTYVKLAPPSIAFGQLQVGTQSSARPITLTNMSKVALNLSGIGLTGVNAGDFAQGSTCGPSVAPGANCSISVTFTPTAKGPRTAAVSISDDGGSSPQTVLMTGTGT